MLGVLYLYTTLCIIFLIEVRHIVLLGSVSIKKNVIHNVVYKCSKSSITQKIIKDDLSFS